MRLRRVIWNPWQSNEELRNMKNQSFEVLCHKQIRNARREAKMRKAKRKIEDSSYSLLLHFWSTSRSPFSTCYIPFQSSGSQESNASNRVRFGAEMRKLQPLKDNCSKLKEGFRKVLRNHPFVARYFAAFLHSAMVFP